MLDFYLDARSGVSTYMQIVHQVQRAVRCGLLTPGDRLPTAREVVASLAINPNTVLKAYTQLEHEGIAYSRPGVGTFIADTAPAPVSATEQRRLRPGLDAWVERARAAGLSGEAVWSLVDSAIENAYGVHVP